MKRILACALTLAAANVAAAFTLPQGSHAPPAHAVTTAVARVAPASDDHTVYNHQFAPTQVELSSWTVRSGDTLSLIAKNRYGKEAAWPLIYWANHKQVRWANRIQVGQTLQLPIPDGPIPPPPALLEPPPPPVPHVVYSTVATSQRAYHATYTPSGTYHGSGGMESCIISHESGGNSQVMNSSGHYGLYQFSASTWAASGGSSADFGHASVAEQQRVFRNAVAARGYSDWTPYDGC